ncbi:SAM-dependent methyltransferase [Nocardiopsis mwathae]|uniref:SAM-dependent methyltransferase n=1 Tax=Nocardiopsis mwathae TaxID=1472723 RepID=A0A7W9YLF1_9ACTN|nr:N-6 DNA methylase [Nocardiopsis mwathae]MBB6174338.1 SAM-dependent methyltransferase [Nocardiopsis mwathae]
MSQQANTFVTAADIGRLAGVTRATVSNWRRRHADFPAPEGGTENRPLYDLEAVRAWLAERGQLPEESARDKLRVVHMATGSGKTEALFAGVLAASLLDRQKLDALPKRSDDELLAWFRSAAAAASDEIPGADASAVDSRTVEPLRTVLRSVISEGPEATTDVLAERLMEAGATGASAMPPALVDLMADLLGDGTGGYPTTVLDPACGNGTLLAAACRKGASKLFGQDLRKIQAAQTVVRLRTAAESDVDVTARVGDSLRADAFPELAADAVLCNPPYGVRDWGHDELAYDERWAYGVPPKGESELAWVQHCLAHLVPGGRAVLLMPPAVAERAGARRIRAQLVRDGAIRAIIALPQGAASPLHVGLQLWVLQRPGGQEATAENLLFVDAASTSVSADSPRIDWDGLSESVLSAWRQYSEDPGDFEGIPGSARALAVIDLLDEVIDLTPTRHVHAGTPMTSPAQHAQKAAEAHARLRTRGEELMRLLKDGEWQSSGDKPREWRTATVADLLRGGALDVPYTAGHGRRTRSGRSDQRPRKPQRSERPVLTVDDVLSSRAPSGNEADVDAEVPLPHLQRGDVLLPEIVRSGAPHVARVASAEEEGCLFGPQLLLFRPDQSRLDPWFLSGFLSAEQNVNAATTGTSVIRIDPRRLRVPLLSLAEQQRYGEAFRHLHAVRTAARSAAEAAEETTRILRAGLTTGALTPPEDEMS